jgi:hypothetical protein
MSQQVIDEGFFSIRRRKQVIDTSFEDVMLYEELGG